MDTPNYWWAAGGIETAENTSPATLARTQRAALFASVTAISLAGWAYLLASSGHVHHQLSLSSSATTLVMWMAMTVAMMSPTTLHWLFPYAGLVNRDNPRQTTRAVTAFLTGYFAVWLGYCIVGAALQLALQQAGLVDHAGKLPPAAGGAVLTAAGIVWFLPFRRKCLQHCRNPITHFLGHWNNGPHNGFRVGLAHGAWCVGCCGALMLTGLAMGTMNLLWMVFLTVMVCLEKLVPRGDRIAAIFAIALIAWGVAVAFRG